MALTLAVEDALYHIKLAESTSEVEDGKVQALIAIAYAVLLVYTSLEKEAK